MPYYINPNINGILSASSKGDGYTITLKCATAYPLKSSFKIGYNIYMDVSSPANVDSFFNKSPKFGIFNNSTSADILDLVAGETYFFGIRAFEYNENEFDPNTLPQTFNNLRFYPESLLRQNISSTSLVIPLLDIENFPSKGTIKIGSELIKYTSVDTINNNLLLSNLSQRGYNNTISAFHNTDGYDGYAYWDPIVLFYPSMSEEQNTKIYNCENRFDVGNYAFNITDGYRQNIKDILTTDLSASDSFNEDFNSYSFTGWHRIDPLTVLTGNCVGSYIGGEQFCADGYSGVGRMIRGMSLQEKNNQRQEILLEVAGEPCILVRRSWTGIRCNCILSNNEYPEYRCKNCFGTGYVVGYKQFFFNRRSDRRIMVMFDPASEDLKSTENGLESDITYNCSTLTVPTLKDRDFIVRYDQDDNEEFRYEILSVERNKMIARLQGAQKFVAQRIRKTSPIYQVRVFKNTSMFPQTISTTVGSAIPAIMPHDHDFVINEKSISNMSQTTGISSGHNHLVVFENGVLVVKEELGHTHDILF